MRGVCCVTLALLAFGCDASPSATPREPAPAPLLTSILPAHFAAGSLTEVAPPDNALTEVTLYADQPKVYQKYTFETDINGKRVIDRAQSTDPELEADYCYVNFFLPVTSPFSGGRLYVYGQLSNWDTLADCRMKYDEKLRGYECWTLLKQGFYNYQYVFVDDQLKTADPSVVEGDSWETENDYDILVYYHAPGDRYDQLIGFKRTNSLRP